MRSRKYITRPEHTSVDHGLGYREFVSLVTEVRKGGAAAVADQPLLFDIDLCALVFSQFVGKAHARQDAGAATPSPGLMLEVPQALQMIIQAGGEMTLEQVIDAVNSVSIF